MGVAQENLVLEFLGHIRGSQMDVDAMTAMMSDDVVWQTNVPTWKPRVGREERGGTCVSEHARDWRTAG